MTGSDQRNAKLQPAENVREGAPDHGFKGDFALSI